MPADRRVDDDIAGARELTADELVQVLGVTASAVRVHESVRDRVARDHPVQRLGADQGVGEAVEIGSGGCGGGGRHAPEPIAAPFPRTMRQTGDMTSSALEALLARVTDSALLDDPTAENGLVYGRANIDAAGTVVNVNIDPELEDRDDEDVDHDELIAALSRILGIAESRWRAIVDEVASDIEDAVGDEPVAEQIDIRDDLEAASVVVFADAVLLAFDAPKQFPDSRILVQLDEDLEIDGVEMRDRDDIETVEFDTLDELLDHISGPEED